MNEVTNARFQTSTFDVNFHSFSVLLHRRPCTWPCSSSSAVAARTLAMTLPLKCISRPAKGWLKSMTYVLLRSSQRFDLPNGVLLRWSSESYFQFEVMSSCNFPSTLNTSKGKSRPRLRYIVVSVSLLRGLDFKIKSVAYGKTVQFYLQTLSGKAAHALNKIHRLGLHSTFSTICHSSVSFIILSS